MYLNKRHCFKCENCDKKYFNKVTGKSFIKSKTLEGKNSRISFPCEVEVSLVRHYFKVKGVQAEDIPALADYMIQQLTAAKSADKKVQRMARIGIELKNNKMKRLLITGSFWLGVLIAVSYLLINVISHHTEWGMLVAVLGILPVLFTLLGTFILKSIDSLKEETFFKLVKLTLQLNFKMFKRLLKRSEKNN